MARHFAMLTTLTPMAATAACTVACAGRLGWGWAFLAAANAVGFVWYGLDKYRAIRGQWRIPEVVLLAFAAAGGGAGSLLGQIVFRHKTSKRSFRRVFWAILALQVAGAVYLTIRFSGAW